MNVAKIANASPSHFLPVPGVPGGAYRDPKKWLRNIWTAPINTNRAIPGNVIKKLALSGDHLPKSLKAMQVMPHGCQMAMLALVGWNFPSGNVFSEGWQWMSRLLFAIIRNVMSVSLSKVSKITRRFFAITVTHLYISTDTFSVDLCIIVYVIPQSFMFSFCSFCKVEADAAASCANHYQLW